MLNYKGRELGSYLIGDFLNWLSFSFDLSDFVGESWLYYTLSFLLSL
jgi:hypothetical protein